MEKVSGSSKRAMAREQKLANIAYKIFSGSMMVLTMYGTLLCGSQVYSIYMNRKARQIEAEQQPIDRIKPKTDC
uniref:cytochrome c oxidase assembly protein COX14 isoform X1 n=2 Tax=Myxine glutinosa TaxID=7769 RepID=UPI00358FA1C3